MYKLEAKYNFYSKEHESILLEKDIINFYNKKSQNIDSEPMYIKISIESAKMLNENSIFIRKNLLNGLQEYIINSYKNKKNLIDSNKIDLQEYIQTLDLADGLLFTKYIENKSFVLFYTIKKFKDYKLINTFYIKNIKDLLEYIDTQVIYGKEYKYEINSIAISGVGQKYVLTDTFLYFNFATVKDNSPIYPEINVISNNIGETKIRFNLNSGLGETEEDFIRLQSSDSDPINTKFKTDDIIKEYQIFKLEEKPNTIEDFFDKEFMTLSTKDTNSNAVSFIEELKPNRKYYYCFRSIDIHNNKSNPSNVYEVEFSKDGEVILPVFKVISVKELLNKAIENTENYEFSKSFRRFLQINPSLRQMVTETDILGNGNNPAVWDQTFKIKLTSKKTGKVIEVYTRFKQQKNNSD